MKIRNENKVLASKADKNSDENRINSDGNIRGALILPDPYLPITSGPLAVEFADCEENAFKCLSNYFKVEHHSECVNPEFFSWPIAGITYGANRFVIPLKVRASQAKTEYVIFFVIDSGAPHTSVSEGSAKLLWGNEDPNEVIIQGIKLPVGLTGNFDIRLKDVNVLGANFLLNLNISTIMPKKKEDASNIYRIFYLAPYNMLNQAQKMAASDQQEVDMKKIYCKWKSGFCSSDPMPNYAPKANANSNESRINSGDNINLILPDPYLPITSGASALTVEDCQEEAMESLSNHFNVEHHSECVNPKFFKWPIAGIVHGSNRFAIPLKVQASEKSKEFVIYFIVVSGAPVTSVSEESAKLLWGSKPQAKVVIQGWNVDCRLSKNFNDNLKNVNLLGAQFLLQLGLSTVISPHAYDYLSDMKTVFYLTPYDMIKKTQLMAASPHQVPDIQKNYEICQSNFGNSDS